MNITDLKLFAKDNGITLPEQKVIAAEATKVITGKFGHTKEKIKQNFDQLLHETEREIYRVYLKYQKKYGEDVINAFVTYLIKSGELKDLKQTGEILGRYFELLDKFFLSLAQSRKARAGKSFENIHNALFKELNYPFDEQRVINGKPDFIMPSYDHYLKNAPDGIIFTAKRTLRERWRQIVTEGTRGLGFFLATIDEKISANQLAEAHKSRIFIVCPEIIKKKNYPTAINVLSFAQFFKDYLDPAMERWKRNNVIK
ncbi:MAG: type II restriction endonuclease [bacterium]|nr:hypothetical protein [Patescibacteria group bacterium]